MRKKGSDISLHMTTQGKYQFCRYLSHYPPLRSIKRGSEIHTPGAGDNILIYHAAIVETRPMFKGHGVS